MKFLEEAVLAGQKVLLRIDASLPIKDDQIRDDFRLKAILPTINFLLNHQAKVILASHLGRPKGKVEAELSLRPIYLHLASLLRKPIKFVKEVVGEKVLKQVNELENGEIIGLENLRFESGEDKNSRTFARQLASLADLYVNDAFSVDHRAAASVEAITEFLPSYAGLRLEQEIKMLGSLLKNPHRPFIVVLGGAKIDDKLPVIKHLLHIADKILIGGGVANNFLLAQGQEVKQSLVDPSYLSVATQLFKQARGKLILPVDFVWQSEQILDIGPKSVDLFKGVLKSAGSILWSGPLGKTEVKPFDQASIEIARAIIASRATSIVGGGNTVDFIRGQDLTNRFSFVSTGGGALLEFLAGADLPGIKALS